MESKEPFWQVPIVNLAPLTALYRYFLLGFVPRSRKDVDEAKVENTEIESLGKERSMMVRADETRLGDWQIELSSVMSLGVERCKTMKTTSNADYTDPILPRPRWHGKIKSNFMTG